QASDSDRYARVRGAPARSHTQDPQSPLRHQQHRPRRKRSDTLSFTRWSFSRTTCTFTVEETRLKRNRAKESVSERERIILDISDRTTNPRARPRVWRRERGCDRAVPLALRHTLFFSIPFQPCLFDGELTCGSAETPSRRRECVGALPACAVL